MKYFLVFIALLYVTIAYGQLTYEQIDFTRIPQKKIRHYIIKQIKKDIHYLTDVHPSCRSKDRFTKLNTMQNTYLIKESTDIVWEIYNTVNLAEAWDGRMVSFGFLYSKWADYIIYRNSINYCEIDTGQVFFINLKLLYGIYNLPVGLQVIDIDSANTTITFSYLEGGKSAGIQTIKFIPTIEGYTKIEHISTFKSNSPFRDKRLYPFYHTKVLDEFHEKIAESISSNDDIFSVLSNSTDSN